MDEEGRRALREIRTIAEGALLRLRRTELVGQVSYQLEPRFRKVLGMAIVDPRRMPIVKIAYPLWNLMNEKERTHLIGHEVSHLVTWVEFGHRVEPHGIEFQGAMRLLGYHDAPEEMALNAQARSYLHEMRRTAVAKEDKATLWVKDGYIYCKTPYNPAFVQELKADIPSSQRTWLGVDKVWRIAAAYHEDLLSVIRSHYGEPTVLEQETQVVVVGESGNDPYSNLLKLAPDETLKKIYRMIAAEIHPDKGGKTEDMATLNTAWADIKKERGL